MAVWQHAKLRVHAQLWPSAVQLTSVLGQAYLLLGDEEYLHMFAESYASAMHWLASPLQPWLTDADLRSGEQNAQLWVSSLSAFWPGLQVSLPHLGLRCHADWCGVVDVLSSCTTDL